MPGAAKSGWDFDNIPTPQSPIFIRKPWNRICIRFGRPSPTRVGQPPQNGGKTCKLQPNGHLTGARLPGSWFAVSNKRWQVCAWGALAARTSLAGCARESKTWEIVEAGDNLLGGSYTPFCTSTNTLPIIKPQPNSGGTFLSANPTHLQYS